MELNIITIANDPVALLQMLMNAKREHQVVQEHVSILWAATLVVVLKDTVWKQMECHARVSRKGRTEGLKITVNETDLCRGILCTCIAPIAAGSFLLHRYYASIR